MSTAERLPDEPLIFPVGHYTGVLHRTVDPPSYHHTVMLGAGLTRLSDPHLAVWLLAHGPPEQSRGPWARRTPALSSSSSAALPSGAAHSALSLPSTPPSDLSPPAWPGSRGPWSRRQVVAHAETAGLRDPARILAGLVADGLVVETLPETEHSVEFAEAYRLVPLMLGLGNTAEEPDRHGIGFFGQTALTVRGPHYSVWEWSHLDGNLWAGCRAYADTAIQAGITDPEQTIPERVLTDILGILQALLASGTAYLDLARLPT
jgi:hypothetical protein